MSCGTNQFMLQPVLFVLLSTMHYSYASSSSSSILANNTNQQHFAGNNNSRLVTLDQLSAALVMDLIGSIDQGSYYVTVRLGAAAQEYFLIIDTGSDLTWVNCNPDTSQSHHYPHPAYKPNEGNMIYCKDQICPFVDHPTDFPCTEPDDICYYEVSYADTSASTGHVVIDTMSLPFINVDPSLLPPCINIGCGIRQKYSPDTPPNLIDDGIPGLAKKSRVSIIAQLANLGIIRPVFGHCMSRPRNGYFFVGAGKVLPRTITWAPMVTLEDEDLYSPGRADLIFDGRFTTVRNLEIVFDSGATINYFQSTALQATLDLVRRNLRRAPLTPVARTNYPNCWRGTRAIGSVDEVAAYFKTMDLRFTGANNVRFELPPHAYLVIEPIEGHSGAGDVCLAIFEVPQELGEMNIIGDITFQDKLVIYDLDRQRIGWADSTCQDRMMNDRKYHHMDDHMYRRSRKDLFRHSTIKAWRQPPPPAN